MFRCIGGRKMTRKDFNLIAETIRLLPSFTAYVHLKPVNSTTIVGDAVRFDALCRHFAEALDLATPIFLRCPTEHDPCP
jgi:hypothetical protein